MRPVGLALVFVLACSSADEHIDRAVDVSAPGDASSASVKSSAPVKTGEAGATTIGDVKPGETRFEGVYRVVEPKPGQMLKTALALVQLDDGKELVLSYDADPANAPLVGKRVVVIGTVYTPEGRAVSGTHVKARVLTFAPAR